MEEVVPCSHFSFHFFNVLFCRRVFVFVGEWRFEWEVAISWQLWCLHGCYGVFVAVSSVYIPLLFAKMAFRGFNLRDRFT